MCVCGVIIFDSVYSEDCGLKNWSGNDWIKRTTFGIIYCCGWMHIHSRIDMYPRNKSHYKY